MAEFKEVVKEYRRMCGAYVDDYCDHCPLVEEVKEHYTCPEYILDYTDVIENIVMQWAVENPELVYPRWIDYIGGLYPMDAGQAMYEQIPEDIANKLGVKPIGLRFEPMED